MPKVDEDLTRLALMLDADPESLALEPLDQVRAELIAMGINPDAVQRTVAATVTRWLESTASLDGDCIPSRLSQQPARMQIPNETGARTFVEPWTPTLVSMASKLPARHYGPQFMARLEALRSLDVEPRLHIHINRARVGRTLIFALEPRADPKRPGRMLKPKQGQVAIRLLRPKRRAVVVVLGPRMLRSIPLPNYAPGEESEWKVEITVRLGIQAPAADDTEPGS